MRSHVSDVAAEATRLSGQLMAPSSLVTSAAKSSRLWLWFVAAFLLQLGAWTAWFAIAARHKVQEVPLATAR